MFKLAVLFFVIQARTRVGRDTDGKGWCFNLKVPESSAELKHESERQYEVARALGGASQDETSKLVSVEEEDQRQLALWLLKKGVRADERFVCIHPGGSRKKHRWPLPHFAAVAQALEAQGYRVIITGSAAEVDLAEYIYKRLRSSCTAIGLNVGMFMALLKQASLYVANDCGASHLAAHMQTPAVIVMGPTLVERYGPYPVDRPRQVIVFAQGSRACFRANCGGHRFLERVPVATVLQAVQAVLNDTIQKSIRRVQPRLAVLHVHTLPVVSGSGINTFLSMRGQQAVDMHVELACAPEGRLNELVEQQHMLVRFIKHMAWRIHLWHDFWTVLDLYRLIRAKRYDVVHTHNSKAGVVGRLAARLAKTPAVIHTVHGFAFHDETSFWKRGFYRTAERMASGWCDRMIFISQPLIDWARKTHIVSSKKIVKIYSGIDIAAFQQPVDVVKMRQRFRLNDQDFVIGHFAKLWEGKGHAVLLHAVSRLVSSMPNLKLLLVGEGNLRDRLEQLVDRLKIKPYVIFTGFREDIPQLVNSVDVAVLPSLFEGMGRAILEAQAAGKPVVATRVGGIPDIIQDESTGLLVEPGNSEALAQALQRMYDDTELRHRLGQQARAAVDGVYSAQRMVLQIQEVYLQVLAEKKWVVALSEGA